MASQVDVRRAVEFRKRLAAFIDFAIRNSRDLSTWRQHVDEQQEWLFQMYGLIYRAVASYGITEFRQSDQVISRDVVHDAIASPEHPSYQPIASMALKQVDYSIGRLIADVEEARIRSANDLYRRTSLVFWMSRLGALFHWIVGTARGRVLAVIGALLVGIVSGIASGVAQTLFERLTGH